MKVAARSTAAWALAGALLAAGSAPSAQSAGNASAAEGRRYVAIGCVSRQGTAAAPRYVITDRRGPAPSVYRLQGDAAQLAQHVGHTLEVSGPLVPATMANRQPTMRVQAIVWIASSCPSAKAPPQTRN